MRISPEQRRLDRIKSVTPRFFSRICDMCKFEIIKEPLWQYYYYDNRYDFCTECAPTKEAVLQVHAKLIK